MKVFQSRTQEFGKNERALFLFALSIAITFGHGAVIFAVGGGHGLPLSPPRQLSSLLTVVLASVSSANDGSFGAGHSPTVPARPVRAALAAAKRDVTPSPPRGAVSRC